MYACMQACMYECMYVCMHVYMYTYIHIYIPRLVVFGLWFAFCDAGKTQYYPHTYIHTYIHTHMQAKPQYYASRLLSFADAIFTWLRHGFNICHLTTSWANCLAVTRTRYKSLINLLTIIKLYGYTYSYILHNVFKSTLLYGYTYSYTYTLVTLIVTFCTVTLIVTFCTVTLMLWLHLYFCTVTLIVTFCTMCWSQRFCFFNYFFPVLRLVDALTLS